MPNNPSLDQLIAQVREYKIGSIAGHSHLSPQQRFILRVSIDETTGCHLWLGGKDAKGYGRIMVKGRNMATHRFAYEEAKGPIPEGLEIDHLCRNPSCVNPEHLEAVTSRVNVLRSRNACSKNAAKTHCAHGHPFDEKNTAYKEHGTWRYCKACHAVDDARQYRKLKNKKEAGNV